MGFFDKTVNLAFGFSSRISFIIAYKSASSRYLRKNQEDYLNEYYWKNSLWSNSYFIGSISDKTDEVVKEYINNQGKQ